MQTSPHSTETESESLYHNLETRSTAELLEYINREDQKVAIAVKAEIAHIEAFIEECYPLINNGGRLFYIGAGTSGRLAIVDASECPPTFGVASDKVIGIIAGGDQAIRQAVEHAEDDTQQGWKDLLQHGIRASDVLVGISASGSTPYVFSALKKAREHAILTASISCNAQSPIASIVHHAITPIVGPEFVSGSTRMKSGTAQKLVLNMISTTLMIKLGHVKDNRMVDMQLSNQKLVERGTHMIMEQTTVNYHEAKELLHKHGSVRKAIMACRKES